jgi:hypothetical protein
VVSSSGGPKVTPEGVAHEALLAVDPTASLLRVNLFVDGALFRTLEYGLEPTEHVSYDVGEEIVGQDTFSGAEYVDEPPPVASRDEGGCGASRSGSEDAAPLLIVLALTLMALPRRRP